MTNKPILDDEYLEAQKEYHRQIHLHPINPEDEKALEQERQEALEEYHEQLRRNARQIQSEKAYEEQQNEDIFDALESLKLENVTIEKTPSLFNDTYTITTHTNQSIPELLKRAKEILSQDPLQFLLDDLHKRVPGNQQISKMMILGFMSMHPKIDILLHQFITGASGRGKSYEIHQCSKLLDISHKIPFDHITPKSLNYYCEDDGTAAPDEPKNPGLIKNKLLYLDDVKEGDTEILKILGNNDGEIPSILNVGNGATVVQKWDGYPLTIASKVSLIEDDEDGQLKSRYIIYGVEESDSHLKEITDRMMEKKCNITTDISMDPVCPYIIHECLSLKIAGIKITTPHTTYPSGVEPRNLNFFATLIEVNALLNHKNRIITPDKILLTSPTDLEMAFSVWNEISIHNDSNLTTIQLRILEVLKPVNKPRTRDQTIPGMVDLGLGSDPTIKKELDKLEYIGKIGHIGKRPKSYFLL